uniref:Uncharacterized protein n=1 Tax=Aureoumbra lagunensis TaxID=44058 RepID=A0A7S3K4U1_9STRA|mmetsp:Transcript_12882/g.19301  ORF Transcript_12882/g.19301 Transcript_12882/m.19301 type:complete len:200 (+) Transcript_12882:32-631(+)
MCAEQSVARSNERTWILVLFIIGVSIWTLWPKLPTWQIRSSYPRGLSFLHEPHLDLDLVVDIKNANFVPLRLYKDAHFQVHWHASDKLGFGHILATPLPRPISTLLIELRVPTRPNIIRHLAAHGRFLRLTIDTVVYIRAFFLLHLSVAVHCNHIVKHSFPRVPKVKSAKCAYTLFGHQGGPAWLRSISTLRHHWSYSL